MFSFAADWAVLPLLPLRLLLHRARNLSRLKNRRCVIWLTCSRAAAWSALMHSSARKSTNIWTKTATEVKGTNAAQGAFAPTRRRLGIACVHGAAPWRE